MKLSVIISLLLFIFGTRTSAQKAITYTYQDSLFSIIRKSAENPEKTLKISDSLITKAQNENNTSLYAVYLLAKGTANSLSGKNTEALTQQMKAYKVFDSINDISAKTISLINISYSYAHLKNYTKANEYLLQALELTDKENSKLLAIIYANLGNIAVYSENFNLGVTYYEKSLPHYKSTDNTHGMAMVYHGLAVVYQKLKAEDKAEKYCLLALEYQKKTNSDYALSAISNTLGEIYLSQGKLELSKKFLDIGGYAAARIHSPYFLETYYSNLVQWHKKSGNYQLALENHEKFNAIKDSLYSVESENANRELEDKFQNELKTNEIKLLKTQKELATAEIEKSRFWAVILILVTIICLAVIIVLFQSYRVNKKSNEILKLEKVQLAEQNQLLESENILVQFETLKTQVSPHFLFNSLSALTSLIKTDTEKAIQFTQEFSKIFRSTLELKERNLITLREEIAHVNSYLYLQKMRFDSNLNIKIHIDSEYWNDYLPPFSLQMVIENAIKHNVITADSPLNIEVISKEGLLVITNNLQPRQVMEESTKTGVKNIISRYKYITTIIPTFEIANNIFYVKLPLIKEDL